MAKNRRGIDGALWVRGMPLPYNGVYGLTVPSRDCHGREAPSQ